VEAEDQEGDENKRSEGRPSRSSQEPHQAQRQLVPRAESLQQSLIILWGLKGEGLERMPKKEKKGCFEKVQNGGKKKNLKTRTWRRQAEDFKGDFLSLNLGGGT